MGLHCTALHKDGTYSSTAMHEGIPQLKHLLRGQEQSSCLLDVPQLLIVHIDVGLECIGCRLGCRTLDGLLA